MNQFYRPIRENVEFFCFMIILGMLCGWLTLSWFPRTMFVCALFLYTYIGCIILSLLPSAFRWCARTVFYILAYGLAIVDTFCFTKYGTSINPSLFLLVNETNGREAGEFLQLVLSPDLLLSGVGGIALLTVAHAAYVLLHCQFLQKAEQWLSSRCSRIGWAVAFFLVVSIAMTASNTWHYVCTMTASNVGEMDRHASTHYFLPADRLLYSFRSSQLAGRQLDSLKATVGSVSIDSCSFTSPNIVLIIGESYTRHHSSLYGYSVPTTPYQQERERRGELVRFSDVVTPWNITSYVFKNLFTTHTVGEEGEWCDYPLFPELFRRAGYHVTFITNQFVQTNLWDFSGGFFLNNPTLSEAQFDVRNTKQSQYDEGVLQNFEQLKDSSYNHNLYILHVMGQHVGYANRYPASFAKFAVKDYYQTRPELTKKECQSVAEYDNATLYNDYVLEKILQHLEQTDAIVIYVPDHGEEIYDDNRKIEHRSHSPIMDYAFAKAEFEIPFWIWASPSYSQKHPKVWQSVEKSKNRPYMTDALVHTLLGLAGIHCRSYKAQFDVLSPAFDSSRPRLLRGKDDYNKLRLNLRK